MTRKDAVSPELRIAVFERDGGCAAVQFAPVRYDRSDPGFAVPDPCDGRLTLDHVREHPMMGKRAPSDAAHLVSLCFHHHLDGWATAHRPELREYLRAVSA